MADNKSTTVLTPFILYYTLISYYTQHGPLPQQLTPLCLLISPAIASLKTPPIPLNTSSLQITTTQLLSSTLSSRLPNSAYVSHTYGVCHIWHVSMSFDVPSLQTWVTGSSLTVRLWDGWHIIKAIDPLPNDVTFENNLCAQCIVGGIGGSMLCVYCV